ncbi:DNA primase [Candidatus Mycoplasma haematolamae str. Purdue]|uniref:DNA primase n=1 Tax=Mycoplasma haematolamae (strain Purdue) TaxID=1212765 RepID=I7CGI8_MYCHA|nr:CHC2 zinc finger domain-containing protein [Candidatus Mycoplasma haematolamae]AFO52381.1 DNA primase [Candidatus Mycoplasma haematolamae str. Purdue]
MSQERFSRPKYSVKKVIESYLSLEKRGRNFWALCPFHDDNKASLSVSEEKNIFKCFSCGVSGDAISFVMRKESLPFPEALLKIHQLLNLPLEGIRGLEAKASEQAFREKLSKFNKFVLEFFQRTLYSEQGADALKYLMEERKLTEKEISTYRLGYAPSGNELLLTLENIQKADPELSFLNRSFLLKTGIIYESTQGELQPLFRNRIVFPLFSTKGDILSFSSRALPPYQKEVKYVHSRETVLFKKSTLFYNLQSLGGVTKDTYIYLFEGFFDLFASVSLKEGIRSLAILGSEISDEGYSLLSSLGTKKYVLVMDNDLPGMKASLKIFKKSLRFNLEIYSLDLEFGDSKDLAELKAREPNLQLPEPTPYIDWLKKNYSKVFSISEIQLDLLIVNQWVNDLISNLFESDKLVSSVNAKFALSAIEEIFKLYDLVDLSESEQKAIEEIKAEYLEKVKLGTISKKTKTGTVRKPKPISKTPKKDSIEAKYSRLRALIEKIKGDEVYLRVLQLSLPGWSCHYIASFLEKFQWTLTEEDKSFLVQIVSDIEEMSEGQEISYLSSEGMSTAKQLFEFLELYYSLTHQLMTQAEELVKSGPTVSFSERMAQLDQLSRDREELNKQSANVFKQLVNFESNYANSK